VRAIDVVDCDAPDAPFRESDAFAPVGGVAIDLRSRPGWLPIRALQRIPSRMRTTACRWNGRHRHPCR